MARTFPKPSQIDKTNRPSINDSPQQDSLVTSLSKTNLDNTDTKPNNSPADPTVYPKYTKGSTPIKGNFATSGKAAEKFVQKYSPTNTYLDSL